MRVVAIIGRSADCPWRSAFELPANKEALPWMDKMLEECALPLTTAHLQPPQNTSRVWKIIGVALLAAWCVAPASGRPLTSKLLNTVEEKSILHAIKYGSSASPAKGVIEFPVRAAVPLDHAIDLPYSDALDSTGTPLDHPAFSRFMWECLQQGDIGVVQNGRAEQP